MPLRGDSAKANHLLGWKPKNDFYEMICEMVNHDIAHLQASS